MATEFFGEIKLQGFFGISLLITVHFQSVVDSHCVGNNKVVYLQDEMINLYYCCHFVIPES